MRARILILCLVAAIIGFGVWLTLERRNQASRDQAALQEEQLLHRQVYPDGEQAKVDLASALAQAAKDHKQVLLDFGGNWCGDCRVLDFYFRDPSNLRLLQSNYILVHINVGRYDENLDLAAKYGIPLQKGVPALAVLSPDGTVLYSQQNGEFEAMTRMDPSSVTQFLEKWRPRNGS